MTLYGSTEVIEGFCIHCRGPMTYTDGKLSCKGDLDCLCEMEVEGTIINEYEAEGE